MGAGALVVDVRMDAEYRLEGHIADAVCVPAQFWEHGFFLPNDGFVDGVDAHAYRDAPLVVCCGDGSRSSLAAIQLRDAGFADVTAIDGGLAAWRDANFSLEIDEDGAGGLVGSWV